MNTTVAQLKAELDELREELASVRQITDAPSYKLRAGTAATMLPADVTPNDDGSITLNCQLRFLNPFDINTTGVGTITVLPDESLAAFLPLLGRGATGLTPLIANPVLINEIGPDDPMPSNPASFAVLDPGDGLTVGPTYQLTLTTRQGIKGDDGTPVALETLANVHAPAGSLIPGTTVVYRTPAGASPGWYVEAVRTTDFAVCTSFDAASGNLPNQTLGSLTFSQAGYDRYPVVGGACQVNPAADISNGITHIDIIARLNDVNNGIIVGVGQGLDVNAPFIANIWPTAAARSGAAIMPAGSTPQIFMIAQQTNPTLSAWSTTMTHASFSALGVAIV